MNAIASSGVTGACSGPFPKRMCALFIRPTMMCTNQPTCGGRDSSLGFGTRGEWGTPAMVFGRDYGRNRRHTVSQVRMKTWHTPSTGDQWFIHHDGATRWRREMSGIRCRERESLGGQSGHSGPFCRLLLNKHTEELYKLMQTNLW